MKVFLSWSGNRSREAAALLSDWLRCVLQACRPWISTRDLDRGSLWFGEINDQLKDTTVGVVCLTQENKNRPWILFEAGALAKGLTTSRVCTFLIDLEPKDVEDPLAQFNHTSPTKESVLSLVRTLNGTLGVTALDERILETVFNTYWPQFEERFEKVISATEPSAPAKPRAKDDVLAEILENTRFLGSKIRKLEYEVERSRALDEIGMEPPSVTRERVRDMVRDGMPPELILERYRKRMPSSMIKEFISLALSERERDKSKES